MIHPSLACFPNASIETAAERVVQGVTEPLLGTNKAQILQLVPQTFGVVCELLICQLQARYPRHEIRMHANVQLGPRRVMADISGLHKFPDYWKRLIQLNNYLFRRPYSAHAGRRSEATFSTMLDNARELSQQMQCIVAVEGHYPTPRCTYLVDTWAEYQALFESGLHYVVDLSHLNILAVQTGKRDDVLVREMLASEMCAEVHISDNDGSADQHHALLREPWWWQFLGEVREETPIFSEGRIR